MRARIRRFVKPSHGKEYQVHQSIGGSRRRPRRAGLPAAIAAAVVLAADCGGSPARSSPAPGNSSPADGGYLYWTNRAWIGRANLDGTGVNQKFITGAAGLGPKAAGAGMMAVSGGYLYWANTGSPDAPDGSDTIGRARLDGTGVSLRFVTRASLPIGVTVADGYIYWTNNATGTIGRARLDGTGVNQRFITGASGPAALAIDSRHIYRANWGKDTIGRARLNGTGVSQRILTIPGGSPRGVAVNPPR